MTDGQSVITRRRVVSIAGHMFDVRHTQYSEVRSRERHYIVCIFDYCLKSLLTVLCSSHVESSPFAIENSVLSRHPPTAQR